MINLEYYYLPHEYTCTLSFLKDVLCEKQKLLLVSPITVISGIPRIREINCDVIWQSIKEESFINSYFPDIFVQTIRVPNREYMFNVSLKGFRSAFAEYLSTNARAKICTFNGCMCKLWRILSFLSRSSRH